MSTGSDPRARRSSPASRGATAVLVAAALGGVVVACAREDWGGPKGPPVPEPSAAPAWSAPDLGGADDPRRAPPSTDASTSPAPAPSTRGDAGLPPLQVHVTADVLSGKLPDWEAAVAGLRPELKACAAGKGEADAMVEVVARIGPKGNVTATDKTGGSQFEQGVVPCIVHEIERTTFAKPQSGSPRLSIRVKLRRD